jgi:hypothetical protein
MTMTQLLSLMIMPSNCFYQPFPTSDMLDVLTEFFHYLFSKQISSASTLWFFSTSLRGTAAGVAAGAPTTAANLNF